MTTAYTVTDNQVRLPEYHPFVDNGGASILDQNSTDIGRHTKQFNMLQQYRHNGYRSNIGSE